MDKHIHALMVALLPYKVPTDNHQGQFWVLRVAQEHYVLWADEVGTCGPLIRGHAPQLPLQFFNKDFAIRY